LPVSLVPAVLLPGIQAPSTGAPGGPLRKPASACVPYAGLTVGEIQAAVAAPLTSDGPRLVRVDDPDEPAVRTDTDSGLCPYTDGNPSNDPARAK
jgi:hypothetical protein